LADGLAQVLPPGQLAVIVNVADDFTHYGFHIAPDLDTVMYTLSGQANPQMGWGVKEDTRQMLGMLATYGETPWFGLGDKDLATHILRRQALEAGHSLTQITQQLCRALRIQQAVLPVSDQRVATMLDTAELGVLPFQEYFVRHRWQPTVRRIWYDGVESAQPSPTVLQALEEAEGIVICPSNPVLSVEPILAIGDLKTRLHQRRVPCVAVSPLVQGKALKGPADKIMGELGLDASSDGLMSYYNGLIDRLVVQHGDAPQHGEALQTNITMTTPADRQRLANEMLNLIESLSR
jgi:LPPG:FO 2-phospho-L-lactate transferase